MTWKKGKEGGERNLDYKLFFDKLQNEQKTCKELVIK